MSWAKKEVDDWGGEGGLQPPPAHPSEMAIAAGVLNRAIIFVVFYFYITGNTEKRPIFEKAQAILNIEISKFGIRLKLKSKYRRDYAFAISFIPEHGYSS
jgi:hypothetical protein